MVLPAVTEQRVKQRALSVFSEHFRKVIEVARKVPQMVECFIQKDKEQARKIFSEIQSGEEEVDTSRRLVYRELAEIGAILISREDFLRLTNLTREIADLCEGIAFRLLEIMESNRKTPKKIKEDLLELSEATLDTVFKLRETIMVVNYGPNKTMEKAKEVENAEKIVDDLYRKLEIKLLGSKLDFAVFILLRDILQLLEDSADKAEDASDTTSILSLMM